MNMDMVCLNSYLVCMLTVVNTKPPPGKELNINATIMKEEKDKNKEIQLSLGMKELIDVQSNVILCSTILRLINDKKVSSDKCFLSDNGLLHKAVKEDNKLFHALVVPISFSKYALHEVHDTVGHNVLLEPVTVLNDY